MKNKKIKYPSQWDAQMLIDIINSSPVYVGGCSKEFENLGNKFNSMPKGWVKLYDKAFGKDSPWSYTVNYRSKGNKRVLIWDKTKAKKLNIQ
jgi:hypothetical protein